MTALGMVTPGGWLDFERPDPAIFNLHWIARSLARTPRWGSWGLDWSVAQHSLLVSLILGCRGYPNEIRLIGLLHDAAEVITGDVCQPWKRHLATAGADWRINAAVFAALAPHVKLGEAPHQFPPEVHEADALAAAIEAWMLLPEVAAARVAPRPDIPDLEMQDLMDAAKGNGNRVLEQASWFSLQVKFMLKVKS